MEVEQENECPTTNVVPLSVEDFVSTYSERVNQELLTMENELTNEGKAALPLMMYPTGVDFFVSSLLSQGTTFSNGISLEDGILGFLCELSSAPLSTLARTIQRASETTMVNGNEQLRQSPVLRYLMNTSAVQEQLLLLATRKKLGGGHASEGVSALEDSTVGCVWMWSSKSLPMNDLPTEVKQIIRGLRWKKDNTGRLHKALSRLQACLAGNDLPSIVKAYDNLTAVRQKMHQEQSDRNRKEAEKSKKEQDEALKAETKREEQRRKQEERVFKDMEREEERQKKLAEKAKQKEEDRRQKELEKTESRLKKEEKKTQQKEEHAKTYSKSREFLSSWVKASSFSREEKSSREASQSKLPKTDQWFAAINSMDRPDKRAIIREIISLMSATRIDEQEPLVNRIVQRVPTGISTGDNSDEETPYYTKPVPKDAVLEMLSNSTHKPLPQRLRSDTISENVFVSLIFDTAEWEKRPPRRYLLPESELLSVHRWSVDTTAATLDDSDSSEEGDDSDDEWEERFGGDDVEMGDVEGEEEDLDEGDDEDEEFIDNSCRITLEDGTVEEHPEYEPPQFTSAESIILNFLPILEQPELEELLRDTTDEAMVAPWLEEETFGGMKLGTLAEHKEVYNGYEVILVEDDEDDDLTNASGEESDVGEDLGADTKGTRTKRDLHAEDIRAIVEASHGSYRSWQTEVELFCKQNGDLVKKAVADAFRLMHVREKLENDRRSRIYFKRSVLDKFEITTEQEQDLLAKQHERFLKEKEQKAKQRAANRQGSLTALGLDVLYSPKEDDLETSYESSSILAAADSRLDANQEGKSSPDRPTPDIERSHLSDLDFTTARDDCSSRPFFSAKDAPVGCDDTDAIDIPSENEQTNWCSDGCPRELQCNESDKVAIEGTSDNAFEQPPSQVNTPASRVKILQANGLSQDACPRLPVRRLPNPTQSALHPLVEVSQTITLSQLDAQWRSSTNECAELRGSQTGPLDFFLTPVPSHIPEAVVDSLKPILSQPLNRANVDATEADPPPDCQEPSPEDTQRREKRRRVSLANQRHSSPRNWSEPSATGEKKKVKLSENAGNSIIRFFKH